MGSGRSFARDRLRLAGFLLTAAGSALAGVGSLLTWASVGFRGDVAGTLALPVRGVDVGEGRAVLVLAVGSLLGVLLLRPSPGRAPQLLAVLLIAAGLVSAGLALADGALAARRFVDRSRLDGIARALSLQLGRPYREVRERLGREFEATVWVGRGAGLFLVVAGGAVGASGGGLTLAWARRRVPGGAGG